MNLKMRREEGEIDGGGRWSSFDSLLMRRVRGELS